MAIMADTICDPPWKSMLHRQRFLPKTTFSSSFYMTIWPTVYQFWCNLSLSFIVILTFQES